MKSKDIELLAEQYYYVCENKALAKQYVDQGKLSSEDYNNILNADKTPTKKFVGWMAKQWITNSVNDIDLLRNTVEEYDSFAQRGKAKNKDIYQYKSFEELKKEIDHLNSSGEGLSVKDLESDYDVILDNDEMLIMSPHTHEASRKLGLSHFAYRDCGGGGKDSSWCTTYKAPNHFNDYYYQHNVTFLYIKVRSETLIKKLKDAGFGPQYTVVALAILDQEMSNKAAQKGIDNIDAYDALDKQFTGEKLNKYLKTLGLNLVPKY